MDTKNNPQNLNAAATSTAALAAATANTTLRQVLNVPKSETATTTNADSVSAQESGSEIGVEDEVSYVVADGSVNPELANASGLFGGLAAGGLGAAAAGSLLPAALAAAGLAALAASDGDDDAAVGADSGAGGNGTNTGGPRTIIDDGSNPVTPMTPVPPAAPTESTGVVGAVEAVGAGLSASPLNPLGAPVEQLAGGVDGIINGLTKDGPLAGNPLGDGAEQAVGDVSIPQGSAPNTGVIGALDAQSGGATSPLTGGVAMVRDGIATSPLATAPGIGEPLVEATNDILGQSTQNPFPASATQDVPDLTILLANGAAAITSVADSLQSGTLPTLPPV